MPWFPDFVGAVELARRQTHAAGEADPVGRYLAALEGGDPDDLETVWPGELVVYDPRAGVVRGHRELKRFVRNSQHWLAERAARIETVSGTRVGGRAVVELLARLRDPTGHEIAWPLAVVAESVDDRSVVFRTYCSQLPVDGRRHLRLALLEPAAVSPVEVVGRYLAALGAGDVAAVVASFAPSGYFRESIGVDSFHRGADELRAFFTRCFDGGGVELRPCTVTADGRRCAVEYNCIGWGGQVLPAQAGIAIFEFDDAGLLTAVRTYDDIEPATRPT